MLPFKSVSETVMERLKKIGTKWFPLARNPIYTTQNEGFVKKEVYIRRKYEL